MWYGTVPTMLRPLTSWFPFVLPVGAVGEIHRKSVLLLEEVRAIGEWKPSSRESFAKCMPIVLEGIEEISILNLSALQALLAEDAGELTSAVSSTFTCRAASDVAQILYI